VHRPSYRVIMEDEFCNCCDDPLTCLLSVYFPCVLAGQSYEATQQGSCIAGACCYFCTSGCQRSGIQRALGTYDSGCVLNCLAHMYLRCLAITQVRYDADAAH
jgi:Cys-rich protein (TIGR01571 family)